jgi:uncharacterized membrane protein YhaH (DUF805 family)
MWYYEEAGARKGPVESVIVENLLRSGELRADSLVWQDGMVDWAPASAHFDTKTLTRYAPPPLPKTAAPARGFGDAISTCFSKYATFKGRASRSEFWYFFLFQFLISIVTQFIPVINIVVAVGLLLPSLAVTVRRLHDTDRSGWWIGGFYISLFAVGFAAAFFYATGANDVLVGLIGFGFIVYLIAMLVFVCQRGTQGTNRFDSE